MNWLDYVLIGLLGFSALQSFRRGLTREIVSLIAAIVALVLGMWFYGAAGAFIGRWIASARVANLLGFLMVVVAVLIVGAIAGRVMRGFVKVIGLSFFDRVLGALFGLVRGALVAIALLTAYIAFGAGGAAKTAPRAVVNSQIAPYLLEASRIAVDAAPWELKNSFREGYDQVKAEGRRLAHADIKDIANKDSEAK